MSFGTQKEQEEFLHNRCKHRKQQLENNTCMYILSSIKLLLEYVGINKANWVTSKSSFSPTGMVTASMSGTVAPHPLERDWRLTKKEDLHSYLVLNMVLWANIDNMLFTMGVEQSCV